MRFITGSVICQRQRYAPSEMIKNGLHIKTY